MQSSTPSRLAARSRSRVATPLAVASVALLLSGCAASTPGPYRVAGPIATFPGDRPRPPAPRAQPVKVEVEDDGLPSQLAPRNPRPVPDDPSEPWSPNYGSKRAGGLDTGRVATKLVDPAPAAAPRSSPEKPQALAPGRSFVPPFQTATSRPLDPDDIIRMAIAEHEMRQR